MLIQTKELTEYKTKVLEVQGEANQLTISNQKDMEIATDVLHNLKVIKKAISDKKESITKPLMEGLSSIRNLFKPLELGYAEAEKTIKAKMLGYQLEEDNRIEEQKARIARRVEKGTMRADTASGKLEGLTETPKSVEGSVGKISTRTVRKVRIINEGEIPREYMVPDMTKITEAVIRRNEVVNGVEVYEEKIIATR